MQKKQYILSKEDIKKIKISQLHKIGYFKNPIEYVSLLNQQLQNVSSSLKFESHDKGLLLNVMKQIEPITIENRTFFVFRISNPIPSQKKEKPNGLIIESDLSFLQVKEILLFDIRESVLYCFEYSYHYGIWDYDKNKEKYYFRYDKDILLMNPPKKNIVHLHVYKDKPHFDSKTVNLNDIINLIKNNWDFSEGCLAL